MSIRNEDTLRRMWVEHLTLRGKAAQQAEEEKKATEDAVASERTAAAHRITAEKAHNVGGRMAAESDDLADIVNEKRVELGMAALVPGEPYDGVPLEGDGQPDGQPVAGGSPDAGALPPGVVPVERSPLGTLRDALPAVEQGGGQPS